MLAPDLLDHFRIPGPVLWSFSGGRTSGYMLRLALDAHGGTLPADHHVAFSNTGKERAETLAFVQRCSDEWGVPITWLEFDPTAPHRTRIVSHNSASRAGEPFEAAIRDRKMLPNPLVRFCTAELKIRRTKMFMWRLLGYERWTNAVGLRADEPKRVDKILAANSSRKNRWRDACPLSAAGVTKEEVVAFWRRQPFDLALPSVAGVTPAGNCDLCFLKGVRVKRRLVHDDPASATWWADMERLAGEINGRPGGPNARFRLDCETYREMQANALAGTPAGRGMATDEEMADDAGIDCVCTD